MCNTVTHDAPDDQQTALLPPMKWNAWGDPGQRSRCQRAFATDQAGARRRGIDHGRTRARPGAVAAVGVVTRRSRRVGRRSSAPILRIDDRARLLRAGGKSTLDLLRRKDSGVQDAPDAVLLPGSDDEIAAILQFCADHSIAIVPFGGGTSVVGGLDPIRGDFKAVVSMDLRRLN